MRNIPPFFRLPKPSELFWLLFLLVVLASSCTSRHIQKSDTSIDSTVIKENRMLKEALEASGQTIERLVRDSSGTEIIFQTDTVTQTVVQWKEGKIVQVTGPVKTIRISDTHALNERDSAYTLLLITQDSLHTEQANKKVEIRMVEKRVGWPWYIWFILGGLTGPFLWELIKKYYKKWTV